MTTVSIITPCCRPQNIARLRQSVPPSAQWIIVVDGATTSSVPEMVAGVRNVEVCCLPGGGIAGNAQRNLGLRMAVGDYVYFLDDDNLIHPEFFNEVTPLLDGKRVIVVNQLLRDGTLRLTACPPVEVGRIDTAQVILPRDLAREHDWLCDVLGADGKYFKQVWERHADRFVFMYKNLAYYNYLRAPSDGRESSRIEEERDPNGLLREIDIQLESLRNVVTMKELRFIEGFVTAEIAKRRPV